jgi:hypothetical protein
MTTEYNQRTEFALVGRIFGSVSPSATTIKAKMTELDGITAREPDSETKVFVIEHGKKNVEIFVCDAHTTSNGITTFTGCQRWRKVKGVDISTQGTVGNTHNDGSTIASVPTHFLTNFLYEIWKNDALTGGKTLNLGTGDFDTVTIKSSGDGFVRFYRNAAYLTGGTSAESTPATWAAVTDGSFRITVDGAAYNVDGIDFTDDASMDDVAETIQAALRLATSGQEEVTWDTDHFVIKSGITSDSSAIAELETSTGTVGTDISGAGASDFLDADSGHGTVTALEKKAQYSDDGNSWVDMSQSGNHGSSASIADHADVDLTGLVNLDLLQYDSAIGDFVPKSPAEIMGGAVQDSTWTYEEDAEASDAYAITLDPAITAYGAGQIFSFKANTANTGAATLNVNELGAKTIKKFNDQDLEDGDIEAGQIVTVQYDGTNMQMQSPSANGMSAANIALLTGGASSNADSLHTHPSLDKSLGNWVSKSDDTIYQAATDGFVVAVCQSSSSYPAVAEIVLKSDSNSTPAAVRGRARLVTESGDHAAYEQMVCPVKSGDYYKVEISGSGYATVSWVPFS